MTWRIVSAITMAGATWLVWVLFGVATAEGETESPPSGGHVETREDVPMPKPPTASKPAKRQPAVPREDLPKTDAEWQAVLTPLQFEVARKKGTEQAFTGKYWDSKADGTYRCVCCGEPLFVSDTKFDSGCGWPSFHTPVEGSLETAPDLSHGMRRVEVLCTHCGAHLGHVFNDGPQPTGQRYCINSASLDLEKADASPKEP